MIKKRRENILCQNRLRTRSGHTSDSDASSFASRTSSHSACKMWFSHLVSIWQAPSVPPFSAVLQKFRFFPCPLYRTSPLHERHCCLNWCSASQLRDGRQRAGKEELATPGGRALWKRKK